MSNDPVVNQVASLNDIVEIISGYFPLKKAGRNFKACCPFHPEKTPSFMVNPERQIFHCFGCGVGGDVFSFLMKIDSLTFPEALEKLADRAHVVLPKRGRSPGSEQDKSRKEKLFEICQLAAQFYARNFKDARVGDPARAYLAQRGFEPQVIDMFGVGYATEGWQSLFEFLSKKGFAQDLLYRSGLVSQGREGRPFDLFRKRVIFPIFNSQGRVIAFGGRALGKDDTPKYLNSPETEIFQKRAELYGLYQAKKHVEPDRSQFLVVEGYLDLVRLVQSGFPNSVATLGTSLTADHARLMRRYVMEAVLVYDGDRAGESASIRGIDVFLEEGMNIKLLSLPQDSDPDDFLKEKGHEAFQRLVEQAQDVFDFKLAHLLKRFNPKDTVGLVRITNEVLEMLLKVKNSVLGDRYLKRLGGVLGIDENSLRTEFAKLRSKSLGPAKVEEGGESAPAPQIPQAHEWTLISLVLKEQKYLELVIQKTTREDFKDPEARSVFSYLEEIAAKKPYSKLALSAVLAKIDSEAARSFLSRLAFFDLSGEDCEKAFSDCLSRIRSRPCEEEMSNLLSKMKQAEASGEEGKVLEYLRQYQALVTKKKSL